MPEFINKIEEFKNYYNLNSIDNCYNKIVEFINDNYEIIIEPIKPKPVFIKPSEPGEPIKPKPIKPGDIYIRKIDMLKKYIFAGMKVEWGREN